MFQRASSELLTRTHNEFGALVKQLIDENQTTSLSGETKFVQDLVNYMQPTMLLHKVVSQHLGPLANIDPATVTRIMGARADAVGLNTRTTLNDSELMPPPQRALLSSIVPTKAVLAALGLTQPPPPPSAC
jgi:hypothetical protein